MVLPYTVAQGCESPHSTAADTLNYPCLRITTFFNSPELSHDVSMSATASDLELIRCGGNGYNRQFGAVELEAAHAEVTRC